MASVAAPRTVTLGDARVQFPSPALREIVDSGPLLAAGDHAALRARFEADGYLFLRGALGRDAVLRARARVMAHLTSLGTVLAPGREEEGVLLERCEAGCVPFMEGKNELTHSAEVAGVLEGARLRALMAAVLGVLDADVVTFDNKWLRAGWRSFFTGAHVDRVYMGRGSSRVLTAWIPFGDASLELGALAVLAGSHRLPGFARLQATYGELDVERDGFQGTGWFSTDPRELAAMDPAAQWLATDYRAGDVVVFGMRTLHMSTANTTDRVRISCDVRWQPAADARDERYFGAVDEKVKQRQKAGAWAGDAPPPQPGGGGEGPAPQGAKRSMADMRRAWGFAPGGGGGGGGGETSPE